LKKFCARPLKNVSIFAGFACRRSGGGKPLGGIAARRAAISQRRDFADRRF